MAFMLKYKHQLRSIVASGGGADGDGGASGSAPQNLPPREQPVSFRRRSPSQPREYTPPRHSPSPPDAECKIPGHNDHCDPTKLFVGNISRYTLERDLEAAFGRYRRLQQVYLWGSNYGFVVFYDPKDADAARNGLDGHEIRGSHITVQFARKHKMTRYNTANIHDDQNVRQDGNSKLFVSNIPFCTRKQDIKDLFSKYGRVRKVILNDNYGFVEFCDPQDADDARCKLNRQEFNGNHISVDFATGVPRGWTEGQFSGDYKAGDWKGRCFRCGEKGHLKGNCRNSPKDIRRRRSRSRSQSLGHRMGKSSRSAAWLVEEKSEVR